MRYKRSVRWVATILGMTLLFLSVGCRGEDPRRGDEVWSLVLDITEEAEEESHQELIEAHPEAFDALVAMGNPGLYNIVNKLRGKEGTLLERQVLMAVAAAISGLGEQIADPDDWLAFYEGNPSPLIDAALLQPIGEVPPPYTEALLPLLSMEEVYLLGPGVLRANYNGTLQLDVLDSTSEVLWVKSADEGDFWSTRIRVLRDREHFVRVGNQTVEQVDSEAGMIPVMVGPLSVVLYNWEGEVVFTRTFSDYKNHFVQGVYETPEGDLLVVGTATFKDAWPDPEGTPTIVIHKLSREGELLDTKFFGGWGVEILYHVVPTEEGLMLDLSSSSRDSRFDASQSGETSRVVAFLSWSLELQWSHVVDAGEPNRREAEIFLWNRGWSQIESDFSSGRRRHMLKVYEGAEELLWTIEAAEGIAYFGRNLDGRHILLAGNPALLLDLENGITTSLQLPGNPIGEVRVSETGFLHRSMVYPPGVRLAEEAYLIFTFFNWEGEILWRRSTSYAPWIPNYGKVVPGL